jgi:hypothetical protein
VREQTPVVRWKQQLVQHAVVEAVGLPSLCTSARVGTSTLLHTHASIMTKADAAVALPAAAAIVLQAVQLLQPSHLLREDGRGAPLCVL